MPDPESASGRLPDLSQLIAEAYSAKNFEQYGQEWILRMSRHFAGVLRASGPVLNWIPPSENIRQAMEWLESDNTDPQTRLDRFGQLVEEILSHGQNLHHAGYVGHQVPASLPLAGLFDAIGSLTNQVMAIYEMGPWATAVEQSMVNALGQRLGWQPGSFSGVATSGGSLANLTALLTARNVSLSGSWRNGLVRSSTTPPVLLVNADVHYSVMRTAGILGLGTDRLVRIPIDSDRRMIPSELDQKLTDLARKLIPVIAVSACACATPTGAFDPLREIATVCRRHGVWLHVDAAHGGAFALSQKHRHLLNGIEHADSVVWDAHKMMFMPALCAFVLFRDSQHRFRGFQQEAPYLFDPTCPELVESDIGHRTVECTKRAAALGLWSTWSLFGPSLFEDLVDRSMDQAAFLAELLSEADDFELLHKPQCNIVVFRCIPDGLKNASKEEIGSFQLRLRRAVIESGEFYLVQTQLNGTGALRATLINPLTDADHLRGLLNSIRKHADALLGND